MSLATSVKILTLGFAKVTALNQLLKAFFFGLLLSLSFAPFHFPAAALVSLALFYSQIQSDKARSGFLNGLFYGLGYFGLGTSWVYISIHEYGHLNGFISGLITLIFLLYLSLFPALVAFVFKKLNKPYRPLLSCFLFSSLWTLSEALRASLFSGFPWLELGFGQFDGPNKYLLPILGVLGVGYITCLLATVLSSSSYLWEIRRFKLIICLAGLFSLPFGMKYIQWVSVDSKPLSVGVIQANLSMRDKWDESLFWELLKRYQYDAEQLLGTQLIVMPESAIPLPPSYVENFLTSLHEQAKKAGSAILLGIPKPTQQDENSYFNALISLGKGKGIYLKQHLVPFGEYIPKPIQRVTKWLALPDANLSPGKTNQTLVKVHRHPIATLICYELAYGDLLRRQIPKAKWIVSISDDGWFGHSLALYQQLQMAQVRSIEVGRYQVVANNDGLSSVINFQGDIVASLPAFKAGILKTNLFEATGVTPWVYYGDFPILLLCCLIVLIWVSIPIFNGN